MPAASSTVYCHGVGGLLENSRSSIRSSNIVKPMPLMMMQKTLNPNFEQGVMSEMNDRGGKTRSAGEKTELDLLLVEQELFPSREQAQRAVMAGQIFYDGHLIDKPGVALAPDGEIRLRAALLPM